MNSPGHHVPNGWGHDAQSLGSFIPWFVRDIR